MLERVADRVEPWKFGTAVFTPSLPHVYDLNFLVATGATGPDPRDLTAEAERVQGAAGLAHRRIDFADQARGAAAVEGFVELGWKPERHVFMVLRSEPDRPAALDAVHEVDRETVAAVEGAQLATLPWATAEVRRQLLAQMPRLEQAVLVRYFAALHDGEPVSYAKLYGDGRTGQIEDVATLDDHRGKGLARACVSAAMDASRAAGHDMTFIVADVEDWPKELYRRLGFDEVGVKHRFLRRGSGGATD